MYALLIYYRNTLEYVIIHYNILKIYKITTFYTFYTLLTIPPSIYLHPFINIYKLSLYKLAKM